MWYKQKKQKWKNFSVGAQSIHCCFRSLLGFKSECGSQVGTVGRVPNLLLGRARPCSATVGNLRRSLRGQRPPTLSRSLAQYSHSRVGEQRCTRRVDPWILSVCQWSRRRNNSITVSGVIVSLTLFLSFFSREDCRRMVWIFSRLFARKQNQKHQNNRILATCRAIHSPPSPNPVFIVAALAAIPLHSLALLDRHGCPKTRQILREESKRREGREKKKDDRFCGESWQDKFSIAVHSDLHPVHPPSSKFWRECISVWVNNAPIALDRTVCLDYICTG